MIAPLPPCQFPFASEAEADTTDLMPLLWWWLKIYWLKSPLSLILRPAYCHSLSAMRRGSLVPKIWNTSGLGRGYDIMISGPAGETVDSPCNELTPALQPLASDMRTPASCLTWQTKTFLKIYFKTFSMWDSDVMCSPMQLPQSLTPTRGLVPSEAPSEWGLEAGQARPGPIMSRSTHHCQCSVPCHQPVQWPIWVKITDKWRTNGAGGIS